MARPGLNQLKNPSKTFRLGRLKSHGKMVGNLETKEACREENILRIRCLRKLAQQTGNKKASVLADMLEISNLFATSNKHLRRHMDAPPDTLACKLYFRKHRAILAGNLWQVIAQHPQWEAYSITLLPSDLWTPADQLHHVSPSKLLKCLRNDLDRIGVNKVPGFLMAGLDGEFDISRRGYDLHFHIIACGPKADLIRKLKKKRRYRGRKTRQGMGGDIRTPRIKITKIDPATMPKPLTYIAKSFWNHVPTIPTDPTSSEPMAERANFKGRIPEPYHAEWLLWLHKQELKDMTMRMGLQVKSHTFHVVEN